MGKIKIAWRNMQQRAFASTLTAFSMALGVALVIAVLVLLNTVSDTFKRNSQGFDLIVGAKGGREQLVLNTVYHLSQPVENVPYSFYKEFQPGGRYESAVGAVIPYCLGDNYEGYRVVGTIPELFDVPYGDDQHEYYFAEGRNFKADAFFEAVIGATVARKTGLKVGDSFEPTHGVTGSEGHKHDAFEVVGVLGPTGTPNDRALFVNMEGFYLLEGHAKPIEDEEGSESKEAAPSDTPAKPSGSKFQPLPEDQREVTALLVRTSDPFASMALHQHINEGNVAQAVQPTRVIYNLFESFVGPLEGVLLVLAGLIVVVAGIGIMVSIYNSMNDRRRDIAVMRALGANRLTVGMVILVESVLLSFTGGLAGFVLGHVLIGVASPFVEANTGVPLSPFEFVPYEAWILPALIVLAALAGYVPATSAYRTDVSKTLSGSP